MDAVQHEGIEVHMRENTSSNFPVGHNPVLHGLRLSLIGLICLIMPGVSVLSQHGTSVLSAHTQKVTNGSWLHDSQTWIRLPFEILLAEGELPAGVVRLIGRCA